MVEHLDGMRAGRPRRLASKRPKSALTAERLRQLLDYLPKTGRFYWRVARASITAGSEAGTGTFGYRAIQIDGHAHLAHRLAWLYVYGRHPVGPIDHINRKRADNRIANLQESSPVENSWNRTVRSKSGVKGVRFNRSKWDARITRDGEQIWLGSYNTRKEAKAAFQGAAVARKILFDEARPPRPRNTEIHPGRRNDLGFTPRSGPHRDRR